MNRLSLQQNAFLSREEARGIPPICDPKDLVVCPKPRRVGTFANNAFRPVRWYASLQTDGYDSKSGAELDIILLEKSTGLEHSAFQVASSPPFFSGSPPSRASNPLIQDSLFGDEKHTPIPIMPISSPSANSSPSSARKGSRGRMKFGLNPAAVRVEGFDCLNRDSQNSSIPAVA